MRMDVRSGRLGGYLHEPPLLRDARGEPVPELVMVVVEEERRKGIGAALVNAVGAEAAKRFSALP